MDIATPLTFLKVFWCQEEAWKRLGGGLDELGGGLVDVSGPGLGWAWAWAAAGTVKPLIWEFSVLGRGGGGRPTNRRPRSGPGEGSGGVSLIGSGDSNLPLHALRPEASADLSSWQHSFE